MPEFAVDLHSHTRFFHAFRGQPTRFDPVGAHLLARAARWRHLDGVALTNHDYRYPGDHDGLGVVAIPGIEVTTRRGHLLVIGPDPPTRTVPGELGVRDAVSMAHDRGCLAVVPHPFRAGTVRAVDAPFDAVEVNGKNPRRRARVEALADRLEVPVVGGSDAHFPFEVGRAFTRIECEEPTPEAVVEAVRAGRVEVAVAQTRLDREMTRLYREVHRRRNR